MPEKYQGTIWEALWKLIQILVVVIIIPWSSWVTVSIIKFESWKNLGPRFTPADAQNMELKMQKFAMDLIDSRMQEINKKIELMAGDMRELTTIMREHLKTQPGSRNY